MKKKILLIQPENREINQFRRRQLNNFVQLTIPYLAGFIDESKYEITLIDEYNQKIPIRQSFDLVAITVNTPNAQHCYAMANTFRSKGSVVVLGGPHVTLLPQEAKPYADVLMIGEGETTWPTFLDDFYRGQYLAVYESNEIPSLENLPLPRLDLLKRFKLLKGAVFATRGCPNHCQYCNLKQIYHDRFRTRPIHQVIDEIRALKSRFFVFWDDNFFANPRYAIDLMNHLKPLQKKWAAQVTIADCSNDELLQSAKDAGCIYLFVGLESFSKSALASVHKQINPVDQYQAIVQKIHDHGILVQAGIVFGFDTDTSSVFDDTLHACEQMGIDGATVSLLTPFPKTEVFEQLDREGRLLTKDWSFYNSKTAVVFSPKNMTDAELFEGYRSFRKRFYSPLSFVKRMRISRTNLLTNFLINLGYRLAIRKYRSFNKIDRMPIFKAY